jgi:hypothetical protein
MLILAKNEMQKNQPDAALTIAKQIPSIAKINPEVKELTSFLEAKVIATKGGIGDLETAISLMQNVSNTSAYYSESQQLVSRWRIEVQDVATLQRAKSLASGGTPRDYLAAIDAARNLASQNTAEALLGAIRAVQIGIDSESISCSMLLSRSTLQNFLTSSKIKLDNRASITNRIRIFADENFCRNW